VRDHRGGPCSSPALPFHFLGSGTPRRSSAEGCGGAARRVPQVSATTGCRNPRTGRTSGTVLGVEPGYARVSTAKQDLDRQIDALTTAGIPAERIYLDRKSAATTDRPGLRVLLDYARSGLRLVGADDAPPPRHHLKRGAQYAVGPPRATPDRTPRSTPAVDEEDARGCRPRS